jgi:hypothetical protein
MEIYLEFLEEPSEIQIAGQDIHDVDILIAPHSAKVLQSFLLSKGWLYHDDIMTKDMVGLYNDIHVISEPKTFILGSKKIQLIRPSGSNKIDFYKNQFFNLIQNVDLSCCGVSWDGKKLYEDYPNAISHCQNKVFSVNKFPKMYSEKRCIHREVKLENRGWKKIEEDSTQ